MTFLEICKAVRQEAGISGNGPMSVINQTGEMKRIVDWVAAAWREVQTHRRDWDFMKDEFQFNTAVGVYEYSPAAASLTRFMRWLPTSLRIYETARGPNDGVELLQISFEDYRRYYLTGTQTESRPVAFAVNHKRNLVLGPHPMSEYTVIGDYVKSTQRLVNNDDVPDLDEDYHDVIMWGALMKYAVYEAAGEVYARAESQYSGYMNQMERLLLPDVTMPNSLC